MKLKRFEIIEICDVVDSFNGKEMNKIFLYHLSKLKKLLDVEKGLIIETGKPSEKFIEYEMKKRKILNDCCQKDEFGEFIKVNNDYKVIDGKQEEIKVLLKELFENYKDEIEKRKKEILDFAKFLDSEIELEDCYIPLSYFPDIMKVEDMKILNAIIINDC